MHALSSLPSYRTFSQTDAGRQRAPGLSVETSPKWLIGACLEDHPYPSPPMSGSPSPSLPPLTSEARAAPSVYGTSTGQHRGDSTVTGTSGYPSVSNLSTHREDRPQGSVQGTQYGQQHQRAFGQHPPAAPQYPQNYPLPPSQGAYGGPLSGSQAQSATQGGPVSLRAAGRTGRRAKAHVRTACVNCKKAHLSCDEQRPCSRCVASGKQVRGLPS